MKKHIALAAFTLCCTAALADEAKLDYTDVSLSYAAYTSSSKTYSGYAAGLGFLMTQNIYALGNYQSFDSNSITQSSLGVGYKMPIGGGADGLFTLKYETDTETETANGYSLGVGVRAKVNSDMDITGNYSYRIMGNNNDYTFEAGLNYKFSSNMFAKLGYSTTAGDTSTSSYLIGVGFNF
jgi:opacity protein-like surface antigen